MSYMIKKEAFVLMISVLIVGAIVLSISLSVVFVNINAGKNSIDIRDLDQARMLTNSCSELALYELGQNPSAVGISVNNIGDDVCTYNIIQSTPTERIIQSEASYKNSTRKELVVVSSLSPEIVIESWREVADFD